MPEKIKLTSNELGLISLFQSVSGATAKDCVVDSKEDRIIFLVGRGEMGLAIGKGGASIKNVERLVGKPVELVEDCDDPKDFIRNLLNPNFISEVRLTDRLDGTRIATVIVDERHKGAVVGKNGRNAEKARLLARRYFDVTSIHIVTQ